jgi:hypothetical protein
MRKGDWIATYTGIRFYPLDPRPEEIDIHDIAHSLARTCRFNGHGNSFYSVAQHSCIVSENVGTFNKLWGLLHDAAEAYIGDMVRPLKKQPELSFFSEIENKIMEAVVEKFGLYSKEMPIDVKAADLIALRTEARDLGLYAPDWSINSVRPYSFKITPLGPAQSEILFLNHFNQIRKEAEFNENHLRM